MATRRSHDDDHHPTMTINPIDTKPDLPTGTWTLDSKQTTVTVTVKKLGLLSVPATLALTSGTIEIDADHQVTAVDVVADATSYASKNPKRNEHVVSADFLDAANHPELHFSATGVSQTAGGYRADGSVTVKGRTAPISIDINDVDFNTERASFTATATVDRNAIGVDKLPSFVIGRDLELTVTAVALVDRG